MKRVIVICSLLGVVGCFLPVIGKTSISIFDLGHAAVSPWLTLLAFGAPLVAAYRGRMLVLVAAICFGYLGMRYGTRCLDLVLYAGIGGKLIGVSIISGVIATLGAVLETRRVSLDDHAV